MLVCVYYCAFGTRDRGCSRHPAFPAPSVFKRANEFAKLGRNRAARIIFVVPDKRATRAPIRDPYAAAEITRARWLTALLQQLRTVAMGPGVRRDDAINVRRSLLPQHRNKKPIRARAPRRHQPAFVGPQRGLCKIFRSV